MICVSVICVRVNVICAWSDVRVICVRVICVSVICVSVICAWSDVRVSGCADAMVGHVESVLSCTVLAECCPPPPTPEWCDLQGALAGGRGYSRVWLGQ